MEIIWKSISGKGLLNEEHSIDLEYAMRLQVVKIVIKEAEHLMPYLSLVVIEIDPANGEVSVHEDTPEPLRSKITKSLKQPVSKKISKAYSPVLAAVKL
nr:hypothetical protein [uncultured Allomuricauda sp.]